LLKRRKHRHAVQQQNFKIVADGVSSVGDTIASSDGDDIDLLTIW
jgi:hypothetical protein